MQTNAAVGVRALGAVFEIAFDGTTDRRQLTTYLVVTPCLQVDFQKGVMFAFHECFVGQDSEFGFFGTGLGDKRFVQFLIACEIIL